MILDADKEKLLKRLSERLKKANDQGKGCLLSAEEVRLLHIMGEKNEHGDIN